jgi:hypothetical protein
VHTHIDQDIFPATIFAFTRQKKEKADDELISPPFTLYQIEEEPMTIAQLIAGMFIVGLFFAMLASQPRPEE